MMNNKENMVRWSGVLVVAGLLLMVVMALMPLLNMNETWMRWAFAAGAVAVLVARIIEAWAKNNDQSTLRVKRLYRILISSGILYCVSALMMFLSRGSNDWIGFLLAGVVVQMYASWMIDREHKSSGQ